MKPDLYLIQNEPRVYRPIPTPMFTGDELVWACLVSAFAGVVITLVATILWSFA